MCFSDKIASRFLNLDLDERTGIYVEVMNAASSFQNSNGSCCLNAKYDIDQEGLKVSIKALGTIVAEDNRWLVLWYHTICTNLRNVSTDFGFIPKS